MLIGACNPTSRPIHVARYWDRRGVVVAAPALPGGKDVGAGAGAGGVGGGGGGGRATAAAKTLSQLYSNPALTEYLDGKAERYGNWQLYRLASAKLPSATIRTDPAFVVVKDGLESLAFVGSKTESSRPPPPPPTTAPSA